MTQHPVELTTLIDDLPGVASGQGDDFRQMGIRCLADLLLHLPARYERSQQHACIADLDAIIGDSTDTPDLATVVGEVASVKPAFGRRGKVEAVLEDESGQLQLVFFNQSWIRNRLQPGRRLRVSGKPGRFLRTTAAGQPPHRKRRRGDLRRRTRSTAPRLPRHRITELDEDQDSRPIQSRNRHLPSRGSSSRRVLPGTGAALARDAYRLIHRPMETEDVSRARHRLAFDELLLLQLGVMMKRHHRHETLAAPGALPDDERHQRILAASVHADERQASRPGDRQGPHQHRPDESTAAGRCRQRQDGGRGTLVRHAALP